jgi:hypothetical protein
MKRPTGGIRKRGSTWWIWFHANGKRFDESSKSGSEREARALLTQRRREIAEGRFGARSTTVREYLEKWIEARRAAGVRNVRNEVVFFERHVYPAIGAMPLGEVRRAHVRDLVQAISASVSPRTGAPLAPRSILHVYATLRTAFADAVRDEILTANPCTLTTRKGELPAKRDRDPAWRSTAVYSRDEAERLISDDRIPLDRRVFYALMLCAGLRSGEAAGRRWSDYDADAAPLGRLLVAGPGRRRARHEGDEDGRHARGARRPGARRAPRGVAPQRLPAALRAPAVAGGSDRAVAGGHERPLVPADRSVLRASRR